MNVRDFLPFLASAPTMAQTKKVFVFSVVSCFAKLPLSWGCQKELTTSVTIPLVSPGDATLHGEHIYIFLNADCCPWVLVRTCNGQKDYTGGRNCQYPFASLSRDGAEGLAGFASAIVIMGFA